MTRGTRPPAAPYWPVWCSTAIAALGLAAGGTAGPLLASTLFDPRLAGAPVALLVIGSAAAAPALGWIGRRWNRRRALATMYALGAAGALIVTVGALSVSLLWFLVGSLLLGAGNTALFFSRYVAAAEARRDDRSRARAIGKVLTAASVGAVVSPLLLGPLERFAALVNLPPYAALYAVAAVVYGTAAYMQRRRGGSGGAPRTADPPGQRSTARRQAGTRPALVQLAVTNITMVAIMTVTPVHLAHEGAHPSAVGLLIAVHVAAMFAPSVLTGSLVNAIGPDRTFALGMAVTTAAGVVALVADLGDPVSAGIPLLLLGWGWNLGVVAGSARLVASGGGHEAEARGEIGMNLAAGLGAAAAGLGLASSGIAVVWVAVVAVSVLTMILPVRPPTGIRAGRKTIHF